MAEGAWLPSGGSVPSRPAPATRFAGRLLYPDNLKVVLIAAIIVIHAVLSYSGNLDVWPYTEVREVTLSPVGEAVVFTVVGPFAFFLIALLFLVAGLLARPSMERKGPAGYSRERLLRLGVPFGIYVLLVQPLLVYALEHPLGVAPGSYWEEFLGSPPQLDMGPLWFVGVLLIYSLGYAVLVALRPSGRRRQVVSIRAAHLAVLAAVVAPATSLVRLAFPIGGEIWLSGLNFWEWPACIVAFGLGIAGARQGWLRAVPDRLFAQCRTVTLVTVGVLAVFLAVGAGLGWIDDEVWRGGPHAVAIAYAAQEGVLTVFGPVWLLGEAQRHLGRPLRWVGPVARRSAYGAFIVQTPVLIALAVALRPVPVPAELKALLVAGGGVTGSFALAWLLIDRVPGAERVLSSSPAGRGEIDG
jgi:hypothetical protein